MQKWEYLFVNYEKAGERMIIEKPYLVNGQQLPDETKIPNFYDFSNQLGEQGWELIAASFPEGTFGFGSLIFKRPKV